MANFTHIAIQAFYASPVPADLVAGSTSRNRMSQAAVHLRAITTRAATRRTAHRPRRGVFMIASIPRNG